MTTLNLLFGLVVLSVLSTVASSAFLQVQRRSSLFLSVHSPRERRQQQQRRRTTTSLLRAEATGAGTTEVEAYLKQQYPAFMRLILGKNDEVWKKLSDCGDYTIFAVTDDGLAGLGDKRLGQLRDARNEETRLKIGAYHAVNEAVSADELFDSGGVITLGGEVPVGRSTVGGFLGIGGREDGGVTVNGAKVTESVQVGSCIVHGVDSLISPEILWRYMDQLRIPGSN